MEGHFQVGKLHIMLHDAVPDLLEPLVTVFCDPAGDEHVAGGNGLQYIFSHFLSAPVSYNSFLYCSISESEAYTKWPGRISWKLGCSFE